MGSLTRKPSKKEQKIAEKSALRLVKAAAAISKQKTENVKIKIQGTGDFITVPAKTLDLLSYIVSRMAEGKSISIVPSDSEITTQQAADMLNVSRPHIVSILEDGIVPYRKVGSHRRILLEDIIAYDKKLKARRDTSLKNLAEQAQDLKLGYE